MENEEPLLHALRLRHQSFKSLSSIHAVGALHAVRNAGLRVPDDMSVIGVDNIYLAPHTNPPLTTVAQPHYQKGQIALPKNLRLFEGRSDRSGRTDAA